MAELNDQETLLLIDLYRSQENLYNFKIASYHDRQQTRESYQFIATSMNKGWNVEMTKAKLNWSRNGYTCNRRLFERSVKSEAGRDNIVKIEGKWCPLLDSFLRPFSEITSEGISNLQPTHTQQGILKSEESEVCGDGAGCQNDIQHIIPVHNKPRPEMDLPNNPRSHDLSPNGFNTHLSDESQCSSPPYFAVNERKKRRAGTVDSAMAILEDMARYVKENAERRKIVHQNALEKENDMYGRYVAARLNTLSRSTQLRAKRKIDKLLFKAAIGEEGSH